MKQAMYILIALCCIHIMYPLEAAVETKKSRIVTISTLCLLDEENHRTRDYVASQIEHAAQRMQHDLIVAPLTPFLSFREDSETEDLAPFAELAKSHRTYLCIALRENASDGRLFHTSVLLGRNGEIAGKYRKTHALPDDTMSLGDDLPVFETDFGVIGCSIGTDFYFPELYTVEYIKGAEILIWQHYPERFREHFQWIPLSKARALDNHAHLITSMYADPRCYIANRYVCNRHPFDFKKLGVDSISSGPENRQLRPFISVTFAEKIFGVKHFIRLVPLRSIYFTARRTLSIFGQQ